jgi:hypothetical protein
VRAAIRHELLAGSLTAAVCPASLADVPAVSRLLRGPEGAVPRSQLHQAASARVLRLLLTHVGLDRGEVWVARGAHGALVGAVAMMPPPDGVNEHRLLLSLHTELGLRDSASTMHDLPPVPEGHWVMLPVAGSPDVVRALVGVVLRRADAAGDPVVTPSVGGAGAVLAELGFEDESLTGLMRRPVPGIG